MPPPFELDATLEISIERWISSESDILFDKLRMFAADNRLFVAAEIMNRVTRKLRSRESTRMSTLEFLVDEFPTMPDANRSIPAAPIQGAPAIETSTRSEPRDLGPKETRAYKRSDLEALKKRSRER